MDCLHPTDLSKALLLVRTNKVEFGVMDYWNFNNRAITAHVQSGISSVIEEF